MENTPKKIGRPKGSPNKATADLKAMAQPYAPEALTTLRKIMRTSESDQARVAAAKELLDRGFGRAHQTQSQDITQIVRMVVEAPPEAKDTDDWINRVRENGYLDA